MFKKNEVFGAFASISLRYHLAGLCLCVLENPGDKGRVENEVIGGHPELHRPENMYVQQIDLQSSGPESGICNS